MFSYCQTPVMDGLFGACIHEVNCRLEALGYYNFIGAFRWAYKRRDLYKSEGNRN